jgi:hypothetical protein
LVESHRLLVDAVGRLVSSADWRSVLDVARRLPRYSPANCLLLAVQGAEGMVMGYHAWRQVPAVDGGHCQVRRGAKGLAILAPVTRTVREQGAEAGADPEARRVLGFRRATVFDQRALVAEPELPDVRPRLLDGQVPERLWNGLAAQVAGAGYRLVTAGSAAEQIAPANGLTDFDARAVTVRPGLPPAQRVKTLAHELAHTRLHEPDAVAGLSLSRAVIEVEAESVAYLVLGEHGLDSGTYTLPYLAGWSGGNTGAVLAAAQRSIGAAREIATALEQRLDADLAPGPLPEPAATAAAPAVPAAAPDGAWGPAPVPLAGPDAPAGGGLVLYSMPGGLRDGDGGVSPRVLLGTADGRWEIGWDPGLATFYAQHYGAPADPAGVEDGELDDLDGPGHWYGSSPAAIATVGQLEERLGFALPVSVRAALAADQASRPPRSLRTWLVYVDSEPADPPPPETRPQPTSPLDVPGQPATTYRQAMLAAPPLRSCAAEDFRLDILAAAPRRDGDTGAVRQAITYRLAHRGNVIFSADDITAPVDIDPRGDATIRAVVSLTCYADPIGLSPVQLRFLADHRDDLADLVTAPEPPYPAGARIAVARDPLENAGRTGTVVGHVADAAGAVTGYVWRPDRADLPGHPWRQQPTCAVVSRAAEVAPTLAARDVGLGGWTPSTPLSYGATVTYLDREGHVRAGRVLRTFPGATESLTYEVQPDAAGTEPIRLPADSVEPIAGSAYPTLDGLLADRAAAGIALQPGEVLLSGHAQVYVVGGPAGQLTAGPPPAAPVPAKSPPELGL